MPRRVCRPTTATAASALCWLGPVVAGDPHRVLTEPGDERHPVRPSTSDNQRRTPAGSRGHRDVEAVLSLLRRQALEDGGHGGPRRRRPAVGSAVGSARPSAGRRAASGCDMCGLLRARGGLGPRLRGRAVRPLSRPSASRGPPRTGDGQGPASGRRTARPTTPHHRRPTHRSRSPEEHHELDSTSGRLRPRSGRGRRGRHGARCRRRARRGRARRPPDRPPDRPPTGAGEPAAIPPGPGTEVPGRPEVPGGLQVSESGYSLRGARRPIARPGRTTVRFRVTDATGAPVTAYDESHGRDLHLIVVTTRPHRLPARAPDPRRRRHLVGAARTAGGGGVPAARRLPARRRRAAASRWATTSRWPAPTTLAPCPPPGRTAQVGRYEVRLDGGLVAGRTSRVDADGVARRGAGDRPAALPRRLRAPRRVA